MTDATTEQQKEKKERSAAYPSIALEQALEYSKMLVDAYRKSAFSRENAVDGIGYKKITGDTGQKVAALVYFGLLNRDGNSYRNTELAQRICYVSSDEQRTADVAQAAQTPKLFRKLIDEYATQSLPARLSNILIQSHAINPNVADKVAANFKSTLEYAGLMPNGIVLAVADESATSGEMVEGGAAPAVPATSVGNRVQTPAPQQRHNLPQMPAGMQSLKLPSGLVLHYPAELAYAFAMGKFAKQIADLDEAIISTTAQDNGNRKGADAAVE